MGGVASASDVLDLVAAGADAVALGTILFADPWAATRIRGELAEIGVESVEGAGSTFWVRLPALGAAERAGETSQVEHAPSRAA